MTTTPESSTRLAPGPMLPEPARPAGRRLGRRLVVGGLLTCLAIGLIAAHRPLLVGFAGLFRVDNPAPSDAIVVLLGGPGHRPRTAAELFRKGIAPVILVGTSGLNPDMHVDETSMYRQTMKDEGVPASAIVVLPEKVGSTRDEAMRVRDYAQAHRIKRITVVTTSFHTARARWIFRKILRDTGIDVRMGASEHPIFHETNWYKSDEGLVLYFSEAIKTLYYRVVY